MFTGIVEEIGNVLNVSKQSNNVRLKIAANKILEDMEIGSSISINGVCLTAVKFKKGCFEVDVMEETLQKTNLSSLHTGEKVNLERALMPTSRLGGHFVMDI